MVAWFILLVLLTQQPTRDARPPAATATISGRVTERGTAQPLARIVVRLETPPAEPIEVLTDADGRYEFANVAAGHYTLSATPEPHRSTYLPQRFGDATPTPYLTRPTKAGLELKPGDVREGLDFALWRGLAIEGRVLDPWNQPMANVSVSVVRTRTGGSLRGATTNDRGVYRIYGLPPDRYRVCADTKDGAASALADGLRSVRTCHLAAVSESQGSEVALLSGDATGIDIRAQRVDSFTITGTVVDAAGVPVTKAFMGAYAASQHGVSSNAMSDAGHFVMKGLVPGRYVVTASVGGAIRGSPDPPSREREFGYAIVDVEGHSTVAITLSRTVSLEGAVVFEGSPVPSTRALRLVAYARAGDQALGRLWFEQPRAPVGDDLRFTLKELDRQPALLGVQDIPDGWVVKSISYAGRDITFVPTDFGIPEADSRVQIVLTNRVARPSARVDSASGFNVFLVPADVRHRQYAFRSVSSDGVREGLLDLGAVVPGEYLLAAVRRDDTSLAEMSDPAYIERIFAGASRLTFRAGDRPTVDLPLTIPAQR